MTRYALPMMRTPIAAVLAVTTLSAGVASADTSPPTRRNQGYLIGGAVLFAVPYVASSVVGLAYSVGRNISCSTDGDIELRAVAGASTPTCPNRGYGWLSIPFAGPWISLGGYSQGTGAAVALVADGAAQLAGVTLFVIGLVRKQDRAPTSDRAGWHLVPSAPSAQAGLSLQVNAL